MSFFLNIKQTKFKHKKGIFPFVGIREYPKKSLRSCKIKQSIKIGPH